MSRFPVAFRLPAFAFRPSDSRRGIRPSSRSAYRARSPDLDGVTAFRTHELQPGWVPPLPRGRRRSSRLSAVLNRRLPLLSGQSLHPATSIHQRGPHYGASTEVYAIHPSGFPLARGRPDGTSSPSAFPRASHPAYQEPDNARRGGDRSPSTDLNTLYDISRTSNQRIYSKRATSCRTGGSCCTPTTTRQQRPARATAAITTVNGASEPFHAEIEALLSVWG